MGTKQLFVTSLLTEISDKDLEGKGTVREDEKGNKYKWVYESGSTNSTAAVGAYAVYSDANRDQVQESVAADLANIAGVWMAEITGHKYGWIQVIGKGKAILYETAAAGSSFASWAMLCALKGVSGQDYFVSTSAEQFPDEIYMPAAQATQSSTAGNTKTNLVDVILNCRL